MAAQANPVLHHYHHFPFSLTSKTLHLSLSIPTPPLSLTSSSFSFSSSSSYASSRSLHIPRVSTAPVDYAPPAPDYDFQQEILRLRALCTKLSKKKTINDKLKLLDRDSRVKRFFNSRRNWFSRVSPHLNLDSYHCFLLKCLVAAGQEHVLSFRIESVESEFETARGVVKHALYSLVEVIEKFDVNGNGGGSRGFGEGEVLLDKEELRDLKKLLVNLGEIEKFYDCIGGIIGYQIKVLELLACSKSERYSKNWSGQKNHAIDSEFLEIRAPIGPDLSQNIEYASQAALWGIEGLPELGEIYPLGGSADRLGLVDPDTGECLPAAMLSYCGRTLLEGLIRDLQAREFLYSKIYGKQCITPVAIMTSSAKNNHKRIMSLCEKFGWFGRGRSNFQLFEQPLVPAIGADDGLWLVTKSFAPICKPGGHGVIWKLAHDRGIFKWFYDHGRKGATVRQVSNVVAATDLTLLALSGIGLRQKKKLGFASCKRTAGATEGMNVLIETKNLDGMWEYGLSCIEYTEFEKYGITEGSRSQGRLESFPANTNILYVDLHSVEKVVSTNSEKSLPGMVLNLKKPVAYFDQFGRKHSVSGGRLECTMQNIADSFFNTSSSQCYNDVEDILDTYIVYNERRRVTSSAKKTRKHASVSLHQTPDGALLDILRNAHDLLSPCNIDVPVVESNEKYVDSGPPYLILLHPALGPLWEVTRQKFSGGSISRGSELQVEVAEFLWRNVQLDGSLIVLSENVMGSLKIDENGESLIHYGQRCGRCKLENIKVLNKGIDWNGEDNVYWKLEVQRHEGCKIILHGNAEFEATGVVLQGNHVFEVPDGYKLKISPGTSGFEAQLDQIELDKQDTGSWYWNYKIEGSHIKLEYVEL
ncbi:UTP--glucose-1-phosphate uridylyltransferase 3, chloroplastic [Cucumis sativus]|nr:UTP--glucose-1-phosphate uridylyltransferase 3, chloroplastic [Cucumis sativus]KGN45802.2 hypothetical protein Csa_004789 [Cucumis sativus]